MAYGGSAPYGASDVLSPSSGRIAACSRAHQISNAATRSRRFASVDRGYKYPREVWFEEELPKGPTGKILKREIEVPAKLAR